MHGRELDGWSLPGALICTCQLSSEYTINGAAERWARIALLVHQLERAGVAETNIWPDMTSEYQATCLIRLKAEMQLNHDFLAILESLAAGNIPANDIGGLPVQSSNISPE